MKNQLNLKAMTHLKLWKHIVFPIIGLFGLILVNLLIGLILRAYGRGAYPTSADYEAFIHSSRASMILNGASYLIIFTIFVVLSFNDYDEVFKSFKGWKPYVFALAGFAAIMSFNVFYNILLRAFGVSISDNANEGSLNSVIVNFPLASIIIFAFIGPICEELTYRVGLFTLLSKVHIVLAYIATIIVFAFIHFDFDSFGTSAVVNELLNLPLYAFAGFTFCFLYQKFGLASSTAAHVTNNLFSVVATILGSIQ